MYQFRLGKIGKELESSVNWIAPIALGVALLGIASASILIAIASTEIEPNAITCDRLLIVDIFFLLSVAKYTFCICFYNSLYIFFSKGSIIRTIIF